MTNYLQCLAWTKYEATKPVRGIVHILPSKFNILFDMGEKRYGGPGIVTEKECLVSICAVQGRP